MQRIDENTYIDETLVTCAEYQLFIDEMHEQGKYYQPDHWTSYWFPEGQARVPILGVRYSDTVAFCEWLTNREGKEWQFRLPTHKEASALPVKSFGISALGYWILDDNYQFAWIGIAPKNVSALDLDFTRGRAHEFASILDDIDFNFDLAFTRELIYTRNLDIARACDLAQSFKLDFYNNLYTLQERIAGRSPAFEGIRLVKERTP